MKNFPFLGAFLVLAVFAIVALLRFLRSGGMGSIGAVAGFPYVVTKGLLSTAERHFFGVLQQALGEDFQIFAKVRLADIIGVEGGLPVGRRKAAFNRICAKHADFVICDPKIFRIIGIVELDDSSHDAAHRRQRDQFMDSALAAASVPILRVRAQRAYSAPILREQAETAFRLGGIQAAPA